MLDHILVDVISQTRHALEDALLQRQAVEERFQVDVFLGDVSWETSYSLPGEEKPPRVRADVSVDWPTWSQSAYRSWSIGEPPEDLPEVVVEITLRLQRLSAMPDLDTVLACLPEESPPIGTDTLVRRRPSSSRSTNPDSPGPVSPSRPPTRAPSAWTSRPWRTPPPWPPRPASWPAGWPRSSSAWATSACPTCRPTRPRPRTTAAEHPDQDSPASLTSCLRSAWGLAPMWEMISAAQSPPRRPQLSGS